MTNTVYFHGIVRDDASTTSSSDISLQQLPSNDQPSSSSSLYRAIGKAINALIPWRSGPWSESGNLWSGKVEVFSFKELKTATRNFHPDVRLGEGGFGPVFKGWIDGNTLTATKPGKGIAIAIKRQRRGNSRGHKEWLAEVSYLGWLNHPNLVKLWGFCLDNEYQIQLVYEYMPKGSLDNHLSRGGSPCMFSWSLRMKIILGAAKGLAFLHRAGINIIHRAFQSSNILLDSNYNAKLSGFGFARDGPTDGMSHVSTVMIEGTYGCMAPEYCLFGHFSAKSDVYSFGVVLLEILSGRLISYHRRWAYAENNLVEWAMPYLSNKDKIFHILDSHLEGQCSLESAQEAANLILRCLAMEAKLRPDMDEVVTIMEQLQGS